MNNYEFEPIIEALKFIAKMLICGIVFSLIVVLAAIHH